MIAKTGMDVQQTNIDVISHNLSNINTNGYKHSRPVFEDLIYQTIRRQAFARSTTGQVPTGLQLGWRPHRGNYPRLYRRAVAGHQ